MSAFGLSRARACGLRAVRRREDVAALHRAADADADRFLADRDVQKAGQLAGAEPLFDLLLEATDEQHVAEELRELLLRELVLLRHASHSPSLRILRAMRLVWQWGELEREPAAGLGRGAARAHDLRARRRPRGRAPREPQPAAARQHDPAVRLAHRQLRATCPAAWAAPARPRRHRRPARACRRDRDRGGGRSEAEGAQTTLADAWTAALLTLPADWSDLYAELALRSSDHLEHAALLTAPLNPLRVGNTLAFRFRVARRFGYGASPGMVRRCLARLDEEGMPGTLEIIHGLSDTHNVATQGPVWRIGGRSV